MRSTSVMASILPLLVGCTTLPRAEIALIEKSSDLTGKELDTYSFPRTIVDIALNDDQTDIVVKVTNKSFEGFRVALRRNDNFGVKTNLNLTKVTNSDMIDEAGVQVVDNRVKIIGEAGKIATTVLALAASSGTGDSNLPDLPASFDAMTILANFKTSSGDDPNVKNDVQGVGKVKYWMGPVQPDARLVVAEEFIKLKNGLVYAACREIKLFVGDRQPVSTYVSDPRYFRYVSFPQKGKIKIHSQCGTSVTSERDDTVASDTVVGNAVLDEIKKLKDAIDKQKDDDTNVN